MIAQSRLAPFEVILLPFVKALPCLPPVLSLQMPLLSFIQHTSAFFEDFTCTFKLPDCRKIQVNLRSA